MYAYGGFLILIVFSLTIFLFSQDTNRYEDVEIIRANKLINTVSEGEKIQILKGSVHLRYRKTEFFSDEVILSSQTLKAYPWVKLTIEDTITITGDTLFYNRTRKIAELQNKCNIATNTAIIETKKCIALIDSNLIIFPNPLSAQMKKEKAEISAEMGIYNTSLPSNIKMYKNVRYISPSEQITTDTFIYFVESMSIHLLGKSCITTSKDTSYFNYGIIYKQPQKISLFGNVKIFSKNSAIIADSIQIIELEKKTHIFGGTILKYDSLEKKLIQSNYMVYNSLDSSLIAKENVKILTTKENKDTFLLEGKDAHLQENFLVMGNGTGNYSNIRFNSDTIRIDKIDTVQILSLNGNAYLYEIKDGDTTLFTSGEKIIIKFLADGTDSIKIIGNGILFFKDSNQITHTKSSIIEGKFEKDSIKTIQTSKGTITFTLQNVSTTIEFEKMEFFNDITKFKGKINGQAKIQEYKQNHEFRKSNKRSMGK